MGKKKTEEDERWLGYFTEEQGKSWVGVFTKSTLQVENDCAGIVKG